MSTNDLTDLPFPNPEEELEKAQLVVAIRRVIDQSGMTREQAAEHMGVTVSELADLFQGRTGSFSLDKLGHFLKPVG